MPPRTSPNSDFTINFFNGNLTKFPKKMAENKGVRRVAITNAFGEVAEVVVIVKCTSVPGKLVMYNSTEQ
ncbi:hypothetical protein QTP88_003679 [Uroleucon formosanum]